MVVKLSKHPGIPSAGQAVWSLQIRHWTGTFSRAGEGRGERGERRRWLDD